MDGSVGGWMGRLRVGQKNQISLMDNPDLNPNRSTCLNHVELYSVELSALLWLGLNVQTLWLASSEHILAYRMFFGSQEGDWEGHCLRNRQ